MKQLKFSNPVFHEGINITVRRGTKWSGASSRVDIADASGVLVAEAMIEGTKALVFADLFDEDIALEHDPNCRVLEGLSEEMCNIYPDFDDREIVTLISFRLLNSEQNVQASVASKAN